MITRTLYTTIVFMMMVCTPLSAHTITVADDGSADFTTIQAAVNSASDGDTVFVRAGIYKETIFIHSNGFEKNLALLGDGMDSTIIFGEGIDLPDSPKQTTVINSLGNLILKGFTITSADSYTYDGISINPRHKIEIAHNKITNLQKGIMIFDSPIWVSEGYHDMCYCDTCFIEIYDNTITNNKIGLHLGGNNYTGSGNDEDAIYDARQNWWGTTIEDEIKEGIYDWPPRIVDYSNWLTHEVTPPVQRQKNGIHQNNIYNNLEWNVVSVRLCPYEIRMKLCT